MDAPATPLSCPVVILSFDLTRRMVPIAATPVAQRRVRRHDISEGSITPRVEGHDEIETPRYGNLDNQKQTWSSCRWRESVYEAVFARSIHGNIKRDTTAMPYARYLEHLRCSKGQDSNKENGLGVGSILCDAIGHRTSPVFAMKFASGASYSDMVALGDEDGYLSILSADKAIPTNLCDDESPNRPVGQWRTHKNAIFDLAWANEDRWMYVASGDTNLTLWDTGYAAKIATFRAGRGSVKALSVKPDCHNVFASAGRDGDVYIHDARVRSFSEEKSCLRGSNRKHQPAIRLDGPHSTAGMGPVRNPKFGHSRSAVTSLCFLQGPNSSIIASGGQDGKVKLWDIRYDCNPLVVHHPLTDLDDSLTRALCHANIDRSIRHVASMIQPALSDRARGLTSLSLHPDGTQLLASYIGGQHLIFDVSHPEYGPIQWFGGNLMDSFYVKSTFTPDGSHIVSGSSDSNVYIWNLDDKSGIHPIVLEGHAREVTSVACNPQNPFQFVSAGDDHVVKFWSMDVEQPEEEFQEYNSHQVLQERVQGQASPLANTPSGAVPHWCQIDTPGSLYSNNPPDARLTDSVTRSKRNITISNALKTSTLDQGTKKRRSKQVTISDMLQKRMRQHGHCTKDCKM